VYLDLLRFTAALVVFFSHLSIFGEGLLPGMAAYGTPSVLVFFVLSGYVIAFVTSARETHAREYLIARCARLYSVVIPTIALTALLDWIGSNADPGLYAHYALVTNAGFLSLAANFLFLNEVWGTHIDLGSNSPYWSLGYEAIYYAIFGAAFYLRGTVRTITCGALALIAGPNIIIFFPVWLLGLASYHVTKNHLVGRFFGWIAFIGSAAAMVVFAVWARSHGILQEVTNLVNHDFWFIVQDYLLAGLFAVNLIGFAAIGGVFSGVVRFAGPVIRWLAGATFTLYLLHVPLIFFVRAVVTIDHKSMLYDGLLLGVPFTVIFLVAEFTERRKTIWRALFSHVFRRVPVAF
jgi:peptidoglycan/LPS O-acetylase OafA/YrhL